jgi:hypothetical protein
MLKTPSLHDLIPALDDSDLHLLQNPDGNPVWLESITAIPSDSYADDFLQPEQVENFDFAQKCMRDHFYVNPEDEGNC